MKSPSNSSREFELGNTVREGQFLPSWRKVNRFLRQNWLGVSVSVGVLIIAILPYEFRPGGRIELLPLTQQRVPAMVKGRIKQVLVNGGDGKQIPAGTVIATLDAPDQENEYRKAQEDLRNQQALLKEAEDQLNRLLNTPRPEEVEVARQQVEVARQQVEVAQQQVTVAQQQVTVARNDLQTSLSLSKASTARAQRYTWLFESGAFSKQQAEDAQRQADSERDNVATKTANVTEQQANVTKQLATLSSQRQALQQSQANLQLVLAGSPPDAIEAARSRVKAARAEVKRLEQQVSYLKDQTQRTQIVMPFDGHLVDNKLADKVGTYLQQGDTFSIAEIGDTKVLLAKVLVPEVAVDQLFPDRKVTAKLLAYPDTEIYGRVVSIQPAASKRKVQENQSDISGDKVNQFHEDSNRVVEVIVELPNQDGKLRPGMTGYAKIKGTTMPVIAAFSRAVLRFIRVEIWSWLP